MGIFSAILAPLLAFYTILIEPFLRTNLYRNLRKQLTSDPSARVRFYRTQILLEWGWVVIITLIFIPKPDALTLMGLNLPSPIGWVILAAGVVGIGVATFLARRTAAKAPAQHSSTVPSILMPSTPGERSWFAATAITAGICVELLYRGFLIYFLRTAYPTLFNQFIVLSIISGAIYGLSRAYLGWKGILQTALLGFGYAAVFYLSGNLLYVINSNPPAAITGSILPAIVIHVLMELRTLWLWKPGAAPKVEAEPAS